MKSCFFSLFQGGKFESCAAVFEAASRLNVWQMIISLLPDWLAAVKTINTLIRRDVGSYFNVQTISFHQTTAHVSINLTFYSITVWYDDVFRRKLSQKYQKMATMWARSMWGYLQVCCSAKTNFLESGHRCEAARQPRETPGSLWSRPGNSLAWKSRQTATKICFLYGLCKPDINSHITD